MHFPCLSLKNRKVSILCFADDIILMSQTRLCPTRQLNPIVVFLPENKKSQLNSSRSRVIIFTYSSHYLVLQLTTSHIKSIYVSKVFIYNQFILEGMSYCCKLDDLLVLFLLLVGLWLSGHLIILFAFVAVLRGRELGNLCSLFFYVNINPKLLLLTSKNILHALAIYKNSV